MLHALPVPARAEIPRRIHVGRPVPFVHRALQAGAFALLCLWSRSSPAAMARQLAPDVLPL